MEYMPRNRMIKTEFWNDEKLATVSRDARLTFIALWNLSDDYGSVRGHPLWLKNTIYPYDEIKPVDFKKWLDELENIHVITPYDGEGERFYYIRGFTKHQVISHPSLFRNPSPPVTLTEDSDSTTGGLLSERESKRESKRERIDSFSPIFIPDFISSHTWADFVQHRKLLKSPLTDRASELIFKKLENWKLKLDWNPDDVLNQSIERGWKGVFELPDGGNGSFGSQNKQKGRMTSIEQIKKQRQEERRIQNGNSG